MADQSPYPYPSPTTQLEQLAGAAQQASSPTGNFGTPQRPPNPRKRKAEGNVSSRGVANLTPDQLAKKRANDREAQRAIRERTRNTIDTLEARIKELESQQPFQELQNVIRSRDAVITENEELKRRLASICALAQPQGVNHGLNDLALATSQQSPLPMPTTGQQTHNPVPHHSPYEGTPSLSQQHLHPELRNLQSAQNAPTANMHGPFDDASPAGDDRDFFHTQDSKPAASSQPPPETAYHVRPIVNSAPTCPLDSILLDFLADRRRLAEHGHPESVVIGTSTFELEAFLDPTGHREAHPLNKVIIDILSKFPDLHALPEKLASYYTMILLLRWQSSPTQENWDRLPEYMRPSKTQLERPHPAWVDHLPWPEMRDRIIADPESHPFDNHFLPYTTTLSLNWPHSSESCIVSGRSPDGTEEQLVINPDYEAHLQHVGNWTLGSAFASVHPELVFDGLIRDKAVSS